MRMLQTLRARIAARIEQKSTFSEGESRKTRSRLRKSGTARAPFARFFNRRKYL
jgi:hypothetical protein